MANSENNFKIVYRVGVFPEDTIKPLWERGCPLFIQAYQVTRNVQSHKSYLQVRIKNISSRTIENASIAYTLHMDSEEDVTRTVQLLDLDLPSGQSKALDPIPLDEDEIQTVDVFIERVKYADGTTWTHSKAPEPLPAAEDVALSEAGIKGRDYYLKSHGINMPNGVHKGIVEDGWWMCPCGAINLDTDTCSECGLKKDEIPTIESNDEMEKLAKERNQKSHRTKKLALIGGISAAAVVAVVLIVTLVIIPMVRLNSYEGMYEYASTHLTKSDEQTKEFLITLSEAGYGDSAKLLDQLYPWDYDVVINTNPVGETQVGSYAVGSFIYVHIKANPTLGEEDPSLYKTIQIDARDNQKTDKWEQVIYPTGDEYQTIQVKGFEIGYEATYVKVSVNNDGRYKQLKNQTLQAKRKTYNYYSIW